MNLIWTKEALDQLNSIETYIGQNNPERAEQFILFLINSTKSITNNSKIGRIVPEITNPKIREIIVKQYRIVYQIKNKNIEILTVFNGQKQLKKL